MSKKDFETIRAKIIAHAWKDPRFKEKLMKNPRAAMKEMGFEVPENIQVRVVEDKADSFTFILPTPKAEMKELSEQELEKLAGGAGWSIACSYDKCSQATCGKKC